MWLILLSIGIIILSVIYRGICNENYWKKRGVAFYEKHKSGGPYWKSIVGTKSMFEILSEIYHDYEDKPAVGLGSFFDKALYVTDPKNIYHLTQTDFNSFYHRGIPINDDDLLSNSILFLNGSKWRLLRQKLTPLFTGAKLKNMYYIIDRSAQDWIEFLKNNPNRWKGSVHEIHDTITRFSTAALSASVFGLGVTSTLDSPFRKMVNEVLKPRTSLNVKFAIGGISNSIYKALNIKLFGEFEEDFVYAIKQVIRQREKERVERHDFADLCVKLQKGGTLHDPETDLFVEPTDEVLAAQAFFFFLAGGDTSSAAMFATLMELGRHPDIQGRVHEEVDGIFEKYNQQLTYDAVSEMEYLDRVVSESLRLHPPVAFLFRQCTNDTVLPVGNVPVEKGVKIMFPIFDIHRDPKYYPNPEMFDPDRFLNKDEINNMTYLPFGQGYRLCIGVKYASLKLKSGLAHFLKHYSVKTEVLEGGIKYEKTPAQVRMKNVNLEFILRNK